MLQGINDLFFSHDESTEGGVDGERKEVGDGRWGGWVTAWSCVELGSCGELIILIRNSWVRGGIRSDGCENVGRFPIV